MYTKIMVGDPSVDTDLIPVAGSYAEIGDALESAISVDNPIAGLVLYTSNKERGNPVDISTCLLSQEFKMELRGLMARELVRVRYANFEGSGD